MTLISDKELQAIVERVVQRTLHGQTARADDVSEKIDQPVGSPPGQRSVALGADHGGYNMKEMLKAHLTKAGYQVVDCGTNSIESVDYPDFALAVAELVGQGKAWRGIIIDGAGIGSCMTANKVPGVRAAMCYDYATAVNSREHNDANVLTLGAGLIGDNLARQIVDTWLSTEFGGGRHARRVDKIIAIENKFLKSGS
jgi:ribose 5-phosphate isomerase B